MSSSPSVYRAATVGTVAAAASTSPFFCIEGSASKRIIVTRVRVSCPSLTAVEFLSLIAQKCSTAISAGMPVTLTKTPMSTGTAAATANTCSVYTAAPARGTLVGTVASRRLIGTPTVAVATSTTGETEIDFRIAPSNDGVRASGVCLDGVAEGLVLSFAAAPATAVTLSLEVEWVEEG